MSTRAGSWVGRHFVIVTKIPDKNNAEEEQLMSSPWSAASIALGPRRKGMAGDSCSRRGTRVAEREEKGDKEQEPCQVGPQ